MDNDERQLVQVKMTKGSPLTSPYTRVFIYRNSVYGYPWFTSVRTILDDPAYAPWFLMFNGTGQVRVGSALPACVRAGVTATGECLSGWCVGARVGGWQGAGCWDT